MSQKIKKPAQKRKTAARLLWYITTTCKWQFAVATIAIVISALANAAGPMFIMLIIDDYIAPLLNSVSPDYSALIGLIAVMAAIYYVGVICTFIYNRLMVNIGQGVQKRIRDEMFTKMQTFSIKYFDTHTHGELMSRYTNDIDTLRQMISQSIPQVFSAITTIVAIFCAMLYISFELSVLAVVMVIIMVLTTRLIGSRSSRYFISQQSDLGKLNGFIEEIMAGQKVVKVFNHEKQTKEAFNELNENLCVSATKANSYANTVMPCMVNIGYLQYVLTAILGGILLISGYGGLTIGKIASFLQYTRSFNMPFSQISQQFNSIIMSLAGAKRIFELIDNEPDEDNGYVTLVNAKEDAEGNISECEERTGVWAWKKVTEEGTFYRKLCGRVVFDHVNFSYEKGHQILKDINLVAEPGEKVAFVGSTGAGKTTITNLINRFYEIDGGTITYDGIDISIIKKDDLRRSLGMVLQDTHLFSGTIMENIRYGNLNATDEEVYAAAKLANADDFIQRLPNGYQTELSSDGEQLSQGQRQLLSIARAAVANAPVLILDEATSSIDTRTEAIVQRGMDNLMKGRTVFVIAHRLSTIRNSDKIKVMDHGRIIESGTHDQLIDKKGVYYQLYTGAVELD